LQNLSRKRKLFAKTIQGTKIFRESEHIFAYFRFFAKMKKRVFVSTLFVTCFLHGHKLVASRPLPVATSNSNLSSIDFRDGFDGPEDAFPGDLHDGWDRRLWEPSATGSSSPMA
jgi:hypothetical protein